MNILKSVFTFQNNKKCFSILNGSDLVKKYFLILFPVSGWGWGHGGSEMDGRSQLSRKGRVDVALIIQTFHWRPFQQLKHLS